MTALLTPAQLAARLGVGVNGVSKAAQRRGIRRVGAPGSHGTRYEWPDDAPQPAGTIADRSSHDRPSESDPPKVAPRAVPAPVLLPEHDDGGGFGPTYEVIGDRYVFHLKSRAKAGQPHVMPADDVRALLIAYSNDGSKATLNEVARTFGMHRSTVREVLRALGKTHDSAPFTDEDIAERPEDELVEDVVRLKEERVVRRAERRVWEETKALAEKARAFDRYVADKITAIVRDGGVPRLDTPPARAHAAREEGLTVFATPSDLHYGKAGWVDEVGQEYSREICARRLLDTADLMIERVLRFGTPARWLLGAGSDWFHIDTDGGTTTKGTPQDTDGSWVRIFMEGSELAAAYLERLRAVAPVHVVCMAGNHDMLSSQMLTLWLAERYRGAPDVQVRRSPHPRQYEESGRNLIGINHGDDTPDNRLPGLMAHEAPEAWGRTTHRTWFTGHWHSMRTSEVHGVRVIHVPSLSGGDRWHARKGYVGNRKALAAYVLEDSEGLIAELPVGARL